MIRKQAKAQFVGGGVLLAGIALVAGMILLPGCKDSSTGTAPGTATTTTTIAGPITPPTFDRQPEVMLTSRKPDKLIVVIDFAGSKAMNPAIPLAERRKYVLDQAVAVYAAYAKKEKDEESVRIFALSVPNRDEYARGDMKNMDELAILDTVHAAVKDERKTADERAGSIDWRKGLDK